MTHNGIQDRIAIVGVGSTGYTRRTGRSARTLAAEAAVAAIRDAGLTRDDIDGVVSSAGMGSWTIVPRAPPRWWRCSGCRRSPTSGTATRSSSARCWTR
ncbi:hypothetical protein [Actinomadura madurae]|uniref:hypothetical protein n=1 Tax=Actinomadura madurae TaxID=1993 RepID=UPI0020D2169E|nr:hypothetical protein [Actinomadura madurae]MCP9951569.1 hypothetical protein [Actinomadura madurae]MCQ0007695.1 hypothetical protein [Actinomadura madurae]